MFCQLEGFEDLDEVYTHQMVIRSDGLPVCEKLRADKARLDSQIWENDVLPMKINEHKYAPKTHDGTFTYYNSEGKITNKSLVKMLLNDKRAEK